jgi:hypothetical protein
MYFKQVYFSNSLIQLVELYLGNENKDELVEMMSSMNIGVPQQLRPSAVKEEAKATEEAKTPEVYAPTPESETPNHNFFTIEVCKKHSTFKLKPITKDFET